MWLLINQSPAGSTNRINCVDFTLKQASKLAVAMLLALDNTISKLLGGEKVIQ